MGAICGGEDTGSAGAVNGKLVKPKIMTVYGDWFDADTRTVMTLIKLGNVTHVFKPIDQF